MPENQVLANPNKPPKGCYRMQRASLRTYLKFVQFDKEDKLYQTFESQPQFITSLADLRKAVLPGEAGPRLVYPRFGETVLFTLDQWAQADPENSYFHFSWVYQPPQPDEYNPSKILTLADWNPNRPTREEEKAIKGIAIFSIEEFHRDDPYYWFEFKGNRHHRGKSLRDVREMLGGEEGKVRGPGNDEAFLSLLPWADSDPDETWLEWSFGFAALYALGRDHPLYQPSK